MKIKPIRNRQGYEVALRRVQFLWDFKDGSPEFDELDVLATLIEAYEREHYPVDLPDPIEAIKFRLEQQGTKTRALSRQMIRNLHDKRGIPANVLIQPTWGRGRAKRQSPCQTRSPKRKISA